MLLWPHGQVAVDADRFEQLAMAWLAAPTRSRCAACRLAVGSYSGHLLPGATYEAWSVATRERLHALFIELLRAGQQWERLAQEAPTDEPAHRELMAAEIAAGNRAAAIRWYARLREALQQELAIAPDQITEALYEQCVVGLQSSRPAFVGRALPCAQVAAWLGMAATERPGGVVLRGSAGIGKTA